jgi:hypothetical protein
MFESCEMSARCDPKLSLECHIQFGGTLPNFLAILLFAILFLAIFDETNCRVSARPII